MILPWPRRDHVTGNGLTDIERAGNIGGEQLLPFLDGKVLERRAELHAGIVDQDIDRTGNSLDRLDALLGGLRLRHVEAGHRHLVSGGRQSRRGRIKLAGVAAVEDDFGAVFGKALRECEPDALRGAGDERPFARQIKKFKCHMTIPSLLRADKSSPPERLLDTVQSEPQEGVGMDLEELHALFEPVRQLVGRLQPGSGQMAGDEMLSCADRFRHQLRLLFRADRLRQWAARSEAATGGRLDRIGNVPAQYDDLPAAARNWFRNRRQ